MKKLRLHIIIALLIVAAISYQTNSPVIGAAVCGALLGMYAGIWVGGGLVIARFRQHLPRELVDAIGSNDRSVQVSIETIDASEDKEAALKEFKEMIARHEQERENKG